MPKFSIDEKDFMDLSEMIQRIQYCLHNHLGFSLVRVGDAENQVMSQGILYTEEELKKIWWANNTEWTGITLPNYEAREDLVLSIKKADVVGVLHQTGNYMWKPMTEYLFDYYSIQPKQICYAFLNTYFPRSREFISLLQDSKVLYIGNPAGQFAQLMQLKFGICPAGVIPIQQYDQIPEVLKAAGQIHYDLALISAGINANILAVRLAEEGKAAIDFGRAMSSEYWENHGSHTEKTGYSNNICQPGVGDNLSCINTLHTGTNIKSHPAQRFSNKRG